MIVMTRSQDHVEAINSTRVVNVIAALATDSGSQATVFAEGLDWDEK